MAALAPSLLLGLLIAGLLHVFVKRDRILGHLGKPGFVSSVKAATVGVPLPLCSCGVLPAALSLKRDGASSGAVTSFLISTPQTGVDSIAVTWGILGWPVAAAKVIAAFAAGVIGGTIADTTGKGKDITGEAIGCAENESGSLAARIWNYSIGTIFRDVYGWIAVGIGVSALITLFMEPGQLSRYPALAGPLGLLAALVLGIPLYVCSVASVPIAAGLIYAGFPVGSALVFLMAGPATNAATMGAVRKALGGRVFLIYILTVVFISLGAGLILNTLNVPVSGIHAHEHGTGSLTGLAVAAASVAMVLGMLWFALSDLRAFLGRLTGPGGASGARRVLRIEGMSCSMCEKRVRKALNGLPGVKVEKVSASKGIAVVRLIAGDGKAVSGVAEAVEKAGYNVMEVEDE